MSGSCARLIGIVKAVVRTVGLVPVSLVMGISNIYVLRQEGELMFPNNYAAQLTEMVISSHLRDLFEVRELLRQAAEGNANALTQIERPSGINLGWPKTVEDMGVPGIYWLAFWPMRRFIPIIAEFTRIRVKSRVERFFDELNRETV